MECLKRDKNMTEVKVLGKVEWFLVFVTTLWDETEVKARTKATEIHCAIHLYLIW